MAFPGNGTYLEGTQADALPDQNVLLAWMRCSSTKRHVTGLAGLGATPIEQRGTVERILQGDSEPCHSALLQL